MTRPTWPPLPLEEWRDTYETLHRWTQILGKVTLALTPMVNHYWNTAFQVGPRGLSTPTLWWEGRALTAVFDFLEHRLLIQCSDGRSESIPLRPVTVAAFYRETMDALHRLGVDVRIWTMPVEIPAPVRFEDDAVHRSYDPAAAKAFWETLVAIKPVFEGFRGGFLGKCSPVHFFWGSFDLAVTRFSGRPAPARPDADRVTREAYSQEVISHGFWPGGSGIEEAAFYAYAAPEPAGLADVPVLPAAASYNRDLGEFILPYEAVRTAPDPAGDLAAFLRSTYERAASLGGWDRPALERK